MLETVNRYIAEDQARRKAGFAGTLLRGRRPSLFLLFSVAAHLVFFTVVFKIDKWALELLMSSLHSTSARGEVFEITELAPSDPLKQVRRAPEPIERAKLQELRIDPTNPNDTHLISRSPRATSASGDQQHPGQQGEQSGSKKVQDEPRPPAGTSFALGRPPQITALQLKPLSPTDSVPPPPPVKPSENGAAATGSGERATRAANNAPITAESGLQVARAQYFALVRAKIWRVNERIMPRDWIERMLTRKVSADFDVSVSRGGRLASARLSRSSGYSTLDEIARQAINTASPFEGFPPDAGDALAFTVTVHYTPSR